MAFLDELRDPTFVGKLAPPDGQMELGCTCGIKFLKSDESMLNWLKHAFSVAPSGPVAPTPSQAALIDRVCREIVRREMTLPAQMMLESSAPLHYLAGQTIRIIEPMLGTVLDVGEIREFATFLEKPGALESISRHLQELQDAKTSGRTPDAPDQDGERL